MSQPDKAQILNLIEELRSVENRFLSYEGALKYLPPFGIDPLLNCYPVETTTNLLDMYGIVAFDGEESLYGIHAHDIPRLIIAKYKIPCDANFIGRGRQYRAQLDCLQNYFNSPQ